jgi:hypothetical protein
MRKITKTSNFLCICYYSALNFQQKVYHLPYKLEEVNLEIDDPVGLFIGQHV